MRRKGEGLGEEKTKTRAAAAFRPPVLLQQPLSEAPRERGNAAAADCSSLLSSQREQHPTMGFKGLLACSLLLLLLQLVAAGEWELDGGSKTVLEETESVSLSSAAGLGGDEWKGGSLQQQLQQEDLGHPLRQQQMEKPRKKKPSAARKEDLLLKAMMVFGIALTAAALTTLFIVLRGEGEGKHRGADPGFGGEEEFESEMEDEYTWGEEEVEDDDGEEEEEEEEKEEEEEPGEKEERGD
ncbi:hypothetical protein Efla_002088 [Eimeria flavescens]